MSDRWLRRAQWIAALAALGAFGALLAALPISAWIESLRGAVDALGPWAMPAYALLHAAAAICLVPSAPLQIGAGLLFGLGFGIPTALAGTWLALTGAFVIGRWLARDRVQRLLKGRPRMKAVESAISDGGWKTVVLLRLSPILPMSLHNYVYGPTRIALRTYAPAAALAVSPGTVMWTWIGALGGSAALADGETSVAQWVLRGVGLAATIGVSVLLAHRARAKLAEREEEQADDTSLEVAADEAPPRWRVVALSATAALLTVGAVLGHVYDQTVERLLGG